MTYIKRFFESTQNPEYTIDDFEDVFLELLDLGFRILEFQKSYIDPNNGEALIRPQPGSVQGYYMLISAEPEDDEEEYDSEDNRVRFSNFDFIEPTKLSDIQDDFQRLKALYPVVISCLKKVESLGKLLISSFPRPSHFRISVVPKGEQKPVSERESEFHEFCSLVDRTIGGTLSHSNGEYEIEKEPESETIQVKFANNLTRGRFNTAINNLNVLKTGVKNFRRVSNWIYDFDIISDFTTKSAELKFKSGKRRLS